MKKLYQETNVYDAVNERIKYLFDNFDNVLLAFSGGKDSGICVNLCYDYAKKNGLLDKLALYHLDYEARYQKTTDYVLSEFERLSDIRRFMVCLPVATKCSVSMTTDHWIPWDKDVKNIWAREMPDFPYVINEDNVPFPFVKGETDDDMTIDFSNWFADTYGSTAVVLGIRADESLNRLAIITSQNRKTYKDHKWMTYLSDRDDLANAYPIYDWNVEDIWIANGKFSWPYNGLYDLFWKAGLTLPQMRVSSPFHESAIGSLELYKVLEPNTWAKLVGRVNGVNFAGIYGKTNAMGWRNIKLPEGHTWESYMNFLLSTLPESTRNNYLNKLETSKKFWKTHGGSVSPKTLKELDEAGIKYHINGEPSKKTGKVAITFDEYQDDLPVTEFKDVPTYKRMCVCIMRNNHTCSYMGFARTKKQMEQRKEVMTRYKNIIKGEDDDESGVWS